jgi:hypothetical protein
MHLQKVGWGGKNWIILYYDKNSWWAFVKAVMNLRVT